MRRTTFRAGNLVEDDRHRYQYDAWNRLVRVQRIAADGSGTDATTLHAAEYDGLGRRIEKAVSNSGELDGTFRFWYNGQQMIERRDGSSNVLTQAYYGTQYIDELVALKLEHGYALVSQDANYNVTTLTDLGGRVLERVFYTEYGQPIIGTERYFGDYDADGDVDSTDDASLGSGQTCWGTATGACRVFDFNGDGTLDSADETIMTALVSAPSTNRMHHARRTSPAGNLFLHQSLVYDAEIGAYQNRAREYSPSAGKFLQRDSSSYHDSLNCYEYEQSAPFYKVDPLGTLCYQTPPAPRPEDVATLKQCQELNNTPEHKRDQDWSHRCQDCCQQLLKNQSDAVKTDCALRCSDGLTSGPFDTPPPKPPTPKPGPLPNPCPQGSTWIMSFPGGSYNSDPMKACEEERKRCQQEKAKDNNKKCVTSCQPLENGAVAGCSS